MQLILLIQDLCVCTGQHGSASGNKVPGQGVAGMLVMQHMRASFLNLAFNWPQNCNQGMAVISWGMTVPRTYVSAGLSVT